MTSMFVGQALRIPAEFEWRYAVSRQAHRELMRFKVDLPAMDVFDISPARSWNSRRRLCDLEAEYRPDLVFTVAGPAYVKFRAKHVLVCAEPWVTHAGLTAYRSLRFPIEWCSVLLRTLYRRKWLRQADQWFLQTEIARRGFIKRVGVPADRCHVIPATCDAQYRAGDTKALFPSSTEKLRLLCFSAYYRHKNLEVVPEVAYELERLLPGREFEFVFTLPPDQAPWKFLQARASRLGVQDRIVTIGTVAVYDGPALYRSCHISFLPTVLEMFSATYPEAMAMGVPIVTSDLDFARDVCGAAALYFQPREPGNAAQQVARLVNDKELWHQMIDLGKVRLSSIPTAEEKYQLELQGFRSALHKPKFRP